jgi:signal transduction histidine kinase
VFAADLLEHGLSVSDRERARVAGDLHDGPIQDLAGISYALGAVSASVAPPHQQLLCDVRLTLTRAIESLRQLMVDLYPPDLTADQLAETISTLAAPLRDAGVGVTVTTEPMPDLDTDTVTTLYRVAREALANIAEHAHATHVDITLEMTWTGSSADQPTTVLVITDNGVGLDSGKLNRRAEGHLGLRLLIDRVEHLGGTCTLTPGPDGGTTIHAALPARSQGQGPAHPDPGGPG